MPNDNQKSVTNNQQAQTGSLPPVPTDDMPPIVMEDTTPPMLSTNDLPLANAQTTPETTPTVELPKTDSGSAAPSDDVVMAPVITTQKKKFAGGKVIATILGLFLLVGGLGAGIVLVDQNQNIEEKAGACNGGCGPGSECGGEDQWGNAFCVPSGTTQEEIDAALQPGSGGLDNIGAFEPAGQSNLDYLPDIGQTSDAGQTWTEWQQANQTDNCSLPSSLQFLCVVGVATTENHPNLPAGYTKWCNSDGRCSISGPGCPTICGEYIIGTSTGGTTTGGGGGDNPTPTPPTTVITASCQDVKAYSSTWTLLTDAQLSQLEVGDSVNFCVTGVATGGSFNKARFTINNIAQAETTTIRPSSTDFCQSYVIPAAVANFNIKAQINHVTLGWK
ncbi:MAG: hypothetical protein WA152_03330 [Microgenomates group bacterium]